MVIIALWKIAENKEDFKKLLRDLRCRVVGFRLGSNPIYGLTFKRASASLVCLAFDF